MKKRLLFLPLIVCLLLSFSGCSEKASEQQTSMAEIKSYTEATEMNYKEDPSIAKEFTVEQIPLKIKEGYEFGQAVAYGDKIYYTQEVFIPMSESSCSAVDVVEFDTKTKTAKILYTFPYEKCWVNELKIGGGKLFWVLYETFEYGQIQSFDLKSGTVSDIKKLVTVSLNCGDDFLTWYENPSEGKIELFSYDIAADKISLVSDKIATQGGFARSLVLDNIIAYTTEENGKTALEVLNLKTKKVLKEIQVTPEMQVVNAQANENYVIWSQGEFVDENFNIYGYDLKEEKLLFLNDAESPEQKYIFSYHLMGDTLVLNDHADSISGKMTVLDMSKGTSYDIIKDLPEKTIYHSGQPTADGNLIFSAGDMYQSYGLFIAKKD